MKNLILTLVFGILFLSACKKDNIEPDKTPTPPPTVTVDTTNNDSTFYALQGVWQCSGIDNYYNGIHIYNENMTFTFSDSTLFEDSGVSGSVLFPIVYNTSTFKLTLNSTNTISSDTSSVLYINFSTDHQSVDLTSHLYNGTTIGQVIHLHR